MTLIDSPRLTDADRAAWARLERYDAALADALPLGQMTARAQDVIRQFAASGRCYVSTSWGKDSTVVAHLAATCGARLPLVYVRMRVYENPDCLTVRDRFLDQYGHLVDYHEYTVDCGSARWWDDGPPSPKRSGGHAGHYFTQAEAEHGRRHITGVRAEESRVRDIAMARWGEAGPGACRPIGRWKATDVFAYLRKHDLPVHPAYAMSYGGHADRRWLRVSPIGSTIGADKQRADWERTYYGELIPS